MYKLLLSLLLFCCSGAYGQAASSDDGSNLKISKDQAIAIAGNYFSRLGKDWDAPGADLDVKYNEWLVFSQKTTHSDRGPCKRTNGCTIIETRTVAVDAETGKIIRKGRTKDKYPNYE
jgi:hypothetical protein